MSAGFPVLLYHAVSDAPDAPWGTVSHAAFTAHVKAIAASGRQPIAISALAAGLRGEQPLPERPISVTFDDGYSDTFDAVALLREHGLPATVFVTTGEIGRKDRLTAEQIEALAGSRGLEIGAHAVRHRRLDELPDGELSDELHLSRERLQEITGLAVYSFAYPHGSYDRRVRHHTLAAGYRAAAAVKNGLSHPADDPLAIARWTVTASTTSERMAEVLAAETLPLGWTVEPVRTKLYRSVRRGRRRLLERRGVPC